LVGESRRRGRFIRVKKTMGQGRAGEKGSGLINKRTDRAEGGKLNKATRERGEQAQTK